MKTFIPLVLLTLLLVACTTTGASPASDQLIEKLPPPCDAQGVTLTSTPEVGKIRISASGLQPGESLRLVVYWNGEERMAAGHGPGMTAGVDGTWSTSISSLEPNETGEPGTLLVQLRSQAGVACLEFKVP